MSINEQMKPEEIKAYVAKLKPWQVREQFDGRLADIETLLVRMPMEIQEVLKRIRPNMETSTDAYCREKLILCITEIQVMANSIAAKIDVQALEDDLNKDN